MSLINSNNFTKLFAHLNISEQYQIAELQAQKEYVLFKHHPKNKKLINTINTFMAQIVKLSAYSIKPIKAGSFFSMQKENNYNTNKSKKFETSPLTSKLTKELNKIIELLIPWRKGPYQVLGKFIDSEWNSSIKWNILAPHINDTINSLTSNKNTPVMIADLGCNNGYFMHHLITNYKDKHLTVVGYDPVIRNALQFYLLNSLLDQEFNKDKQNNAHQVFLLMGYEYLNLFPEKYHLILALGILYHHSDPIGILRLIWEALKPKGKVIIDCQGIPSEDDIILFPNHRYTGKRNFWFLPTLNSLKSWLKKAGFSNLKTIHTGIILPTEQRSSEHAPNDSLTAGLKNSEKYYIGDTSHSTTIENYPPPIRIYIEGTK